MKQKQSNIFKPKHKVVPDSLLSLYTTSSPLNVCSYHNIKINIIAFNQENKSLVNKKLEIKVNNDK